MQIGLAGEGTLECLQLLRLLPHRRLVCLASRGAKIVIAKLFIHADKSEQDYTHELSGYNYLLQSKVLTPKLVSHGLLAQGSLAQAGYYVIYEYINHSLSLQQCISVRADDASMILIIN